MSPSRSTSRLRWNGHSVRDASVRVAHVVCTSGTSFGVTFLSLFPELNVGTKWGELFNSPHSLFVSPSMLGSYRSTHYRPAHIAPHTICQTHRQCELAAWHQDSVQCKDHRGSQKACTQHCIVRRELYSYSGEGKCQHECSRGSHDGTPNTYSGVPGQRRHSIALRDAAVYAVEII